MGLLCIYSKLFVFGSWLYFAFYFIVKIKWTIGDDVRIKKIKIKLDHSVYNKIEVGFLGPNQN